MKIFGRLVLSIALALTATVVCWAENPRHDSASTNQLLLKAYGHGPMRFEANKGQFDPQVKFISRGPDHTLFLTSGEAVIVLPGRVEESSGRKRFARRNRNISSEPPTVARLTLLGSNPSPQVRGMDEAASRSNYLIGKDPQAWRTGVPHYARVLYQEVYPGVDLAYYGNREGRLEYDFIVSPGADPKAITLAMGYDGESDPRSLRIDENGDLLLENDAHGIRFHRPVVYQDIGEERRPVEAHYVLKAERQVAFQLGPYDAMYPVVIDPFLTFSSFLGGTSNDVANAVAVDGSGNIYVTGFTNSSNFPTQGAIQASLKVGDCGGVNCPDAFITKFDSTPGLVYSTYFGGTGADIGNGIAFDSSGNAYVTGRTDSDDFPTNGAVTPYDATFGGGTCTQAGVNVVCNDAFVVKLSPDGSTLEYSTYFGSTGDEDVATGVAVDTSGNAYITGRVSSDSLPITLGVFQETPGGGDCGMTLCLDAFVAKFDPTQDGAASLVYSTYLGATDNDAATGIGVDAAGNAFVVGRTEALDFTVLNAAQPNPPGGAEDAFLTVLNSDATALLYSTYIGGNGQDDANAIAVSGGFAFVVGVTDSDDLPANGTFQTSWGGGTCTEGGNLFPCFDAFVMKFDTTLSGVPSLIFSTYLGGSGDNSDDLALGVAVDGTGNVHVTGFTQSTNFPTASPFQSTNFGGFDAFISVFNSTGTDLTYSSYLGGTQFESTNGIALNPSGNPIIVGETDSSGFPDSSGANFGGVTDAFVAGVDAGGTPADFTLTAVSGSMSVNPGQTANYTLTVTPTNGLRGLVSFTCTGAPSLSTCTAPAPITLDGSNPQNVTVRVTTTAPSAVPPTFGPVTGPPTQNPFSVLPWLAALLGLMTVIIVLRSRQRRAWLFLMPVLALALAWTACGGGGGGGGGGGNPGTPSGTYQLTVAASSGSLGQQVNLSLTVN